MKKSTTVLTLATLALAAGLFAVGCSSSPKAESAPESILSSDPMVPQQEEAIDSLNLGASSAGRAH